ncbi:hypothetical protein PJE062_1465 [Pseudovibrio sp. JE062]|nr:hypothetical protein PJE062_1465 [Pseudovibrio sp. JE062]
MAASGPVSVRLAYSCMTKAEVGLDGLRSQLHVDLIQHGT